MQKNIEYLGRWWVGEDENNCVEGILTFNIISNTIKLKLIGSFSQSCELTKCIEVDFLHGFTTTGKKITLLRCYRRNLTMSTHGKTTVEYNAQMLIIGNYYYDYNQIKFKNISVTYDLLDLWLSVFPFKIYDGKDDNNIFRIEYVKPKLNKAVVDGINIEVVVDFKAIRKSYKGINLMLTPYIRFSKEKGGITLAESFKEINKFGDLLTFCSDVYIKPIKISAKDTNDTNNEIIIRNSVDNSKKLEMTTNRDFILLYKDIKDDFQNYMSIWKEKYQILGPVIEYFVDAHKGGMFTQVSFLKLLQSLEAFSRRNRNNFKEDKKEYQARVDRILGYIQTNEDREWLKEILKYSNEPSLHTRLKHIFKETNFLLNLSSKKIKKLVYKIVETRNYYTHFDETKKDKVLDMNTLFYLGQYIMLVLKSLFLKELGFDNDYIKKSIIKKNNLQIIAENLGL